MEITLPPEWEKRIADKVAGGEFNSANDVIEEGLRRLFAEEQTPDGSFTALCAEIEKGVACADRGELMDGDAFFAELDDSYVS